LENSYKLIGIIYKMRIFCVSDIHVNYPENKLWCKEISDTEFQNDVIILAGDISHSMKHLEETFAIFKTKFKEVFFVPGNHDFWILIGEHEIYKDSLDKFCKIRELCDRMGVHTRPKEFEGNVWVIPLFSWYDPALDNENDSADHPVQVQTWNDYRYCKWPEYIKDDRDLNRYFLNLNEVVIKEVLEAIQSKKSHSEDKNWTTPYIITYSHFLPRRECLPKREVLFIDFLPKVVGSKELDDQVRRLHSKVHVFGHTHINWNEVIEGVHYVQRALRYPTERNSYPSPTDLLDMLIYDQMSKRDNQYDYLKEASIRFKEKNRNLYPTLNK